MPPRDVITRDTLTEQRIDEIRREAAAIGDFDILSREARERSRREMLADHPAGSDLWVFGYGSLMWNPAIHVKAARPALLHGYHRRFCLWTPLGRGTPERPGLTLALEPGGRCRGMALCIDAGLVESESEIVWRREMLSGAYCWRWVQVRTADGPLRAVTFVMNRRNPRYAGRLADAEVAAAIARAEGRIGRCADYLRSTVRHLDELGCSDGPMHRLLCEVETLCTARAGT